MKIDDVAKKAPGLGTIANQTKANRSTEKAGVAKTDTVRLSSQSQALSGASADNSVFDISKVQEIKDAIAGGRFQVDAGKIADGLIDTVKDLIRPSRG
jgi:negative regulator of flagellin synthesis FlgM